MHAGNLVLDHCYIRARSQTSSATRIYFSLGYGHQGLIKYVARITKHIAYGRLPTYRQVKLSVVILSALVPVIGSEAVVPEALRHPEPGNHC